MGYEPAPRIDPVAPAPSLLTSARQLTDVDWRTGVQWTPACQPTYVNEFCAGGTNRTTPNVRATEHVVPFTVYTPLLCDRFAGEVNLADLPDAARALTETHTAKAIAEALWLGTGTPASDTAIPTLRNTAFNVDAASVSELDDGVAQLLVHYEIATDGEGGAVVHMPSGLAVYALGGGAGGARLCWPEGNVYRGPLGSLFVPGPGYPNGQSAAGANGNGPGPEGGPYLGNGPDESWIYVTGPVEYAASPVVVLPEDDGDRSVVRTNLYEVWGERQALVRFDPCKVFATKVTNPAPMPEVS